MTMNRPKMNQPVSWLGGLTPQQFMKRYWQKKPLLVRQAFPNFLPPVSIESVLALATNDLAESRLIRCQPKSQKWSLQHGPFLPNEIPKLSQPNWTILVQQANGFFNGADRFLDAFRFIPEARLDDLMISVAGPKGGVGPHVDSYDVFLVQAQGQRHWEISQTKDLELDPNAPLKILKRFSPQKDWVLEPGDLLYLPPQVAHRGTAVGSHCMTWSVGFRAPGRPALADAVWARHLDTMTERHWRDPWLTATNEPGAMPKSLLKALTEEMMRTTPPKRVVQQAIVATLSEPPQQAVFTAPKKTETLAAFIQKTEKKGLKLHPFSRLLYLENSFFLNGEIWDVPKSVAGQKLIKTLANTRRLAFAPGRFSAQPAAIKNSLWNAFLAGWIVYDSRADQG
jgi:50S ribosomal protein L16 3-hydroxylase